MGAVKKKSQFEKQHIWFVKCLTSENGVFDGGGGESGEEGEDKIDLTSDSLGGNRKNKAKPVMSLYTIVVLGRPGGD